MKNMNLFFQMSTITSMLVAGMFTLAVAQDADSQSTKQKITIDIEVIENGEVTKISKEINAADGANIHDILKDLGIMDDLDITGTGERLEIKVRKHVKGEMEHDIDVEVTGEGHNNLTQDKLEKRPLLGVYPATYEKNGQKGALITSVVKESAAEKAGLLADDIIIAVNTTPITSNTQLQQIIQSFEIGQEVNVKYLRNGAESAQLISLGAAKDHDFSVQRMAPNGNQRFHFEGGAKPEEMRQYIQEMSIDAEFDQKTNEDGAFLGITSGECYSGQDNGVLIGQVIDESSAEIMGA